MVDLTGTDQAPVSSALVVQLTAASRPVTAPNCLLGQGNGAAQVVLPGKMNRLEDWSRTMMTSPRLLMLGARTWLVVVCALVVAHAGLVASASLPTLYLHRPLFFDLSRCSSITRQGVPRPSELAVPYYRSMGWARSVLTEPYSEAEVDTIEQCVEGVISSSTEKPVLFATWVDPFDPGLDSGQWLVLHEGDHAVVCVAELLGCSDEEDIPLVGKGCSLASIHAVLVTVRSQLEVAGVPVSTVPLVKNPRPLARRLAEVYTEPTYTPPQPRINAVVHLRRKSWDIPVVLLEGRQVYTCMAESVLAHAYRVGALGEGIYGSWGFLEAFLLELIVPECSRSRFACSEFLGSLPRTPLPLIVAPVALQEGAMSRVFILERPPTFPLVARSYVYDKCKDFVAKLPMPPGLAGEPHGRSVEALVAWAWGRMCNRCQSTQPCPSLPDIDCDSDYIRLDEVEDSIGPYGFDGTAPVFREGSFHNFVDQTIIAQVSGLRFSKSNFDTAGTAIHFAGSTLVPQAYMSIVQVSGTIVLAYFMARPAIFNDELYDWEEDHCVKGETSVKAELLTAMERIIQPCAALSQDGGKTFHMYEDFTYDARYRECVAQYEQRGNQDVCGKDVIKEVIACLAPYHRKCGVLFRTTDGLEERFSLEAFTPFLDPNPSAPASELCKLITKIRTRAQSAVKFVSEDCVNWRETGVIVFDRMSTMASSIDSSVFWDSGSSLIWDSRTRMYAALFRLNPMYGSRAVQVAFSRDFTHWSAPVPVRVDGSLDGPMVHLGLDYSAPVSAITGTEGNGDRVRFGRRNVEFLEDWYTPNASLWPQAGYIFATAMRCIKCFPFRCDTVVRISRDMGLSWHTPGATGDANDWVSVMNELSSHPQLYPPLYIADPSNPLSQAQEKSILYEKLGKIELKFDSAGSSFPICVDTPYNYNDMPVQGHATASGEKTTSFYVLHSAQTDKGYLARYTASHDHFTYLHAENNTCLWAEMTTVEMSWEGGAWALNVQKNPLCSMAVKAEIQVKNGDGLWTAHTGYSIDDADIIDSVTEGGLSLLQWQGQIATIGDLACAGPARGDYNVLLPRSKASRACFVRIRIQFAGAQLYGIHTVEYTRT